MIMLTNERNKIEGERIGGMMQISTIVELVFYEISTQYIEYLKEFYNDKKISAIPGNNYIEGQQRDSW